MADKVITFLEDAGREAEKVLKFVLPYAEAAEPIIDVVLPAFGPLYASTVNLIVKAEAASVAAGAQSGTGEQKLSFVITALEPIAVAYLESVGVSAPTTTQIENWINACVAGLNAYGALTTPAATTPVTTTVVVPATAASTMTISETK